MKSSRALYERYQATFQAYCDVCATAPERGHRADAAEFSDLRRLLLPHAESGDMLCQYALATILSLGLCCTSEAEIQAGHAAAIEEATRWWTAAAVKGFWPALDNLVTSGVGAEAERVRESRHQLEQERPDLVGSSHSMPVYGPNFVQELSRRLYGRVITDVGD